MYSILPILWFGRFLTMGLNKLKKLLGVPLPIVEENNNDKIRRKRKKKII